MYWKHFFFIDKTKLSIQETPRKVSCISVSQVFQFLSSNFVEAISNILDWHEIKDNDEGNSEVKECASFSQNVIFNNELNFMCINHVNKLVFAHLNINSLRNKLEFSIEFVRGKVDILMIKETRIDVSFPLDQFKFKVFHNIFLIAIEAVRVLCFLLGKMYWLNW